jgi:hypothetical protein
MTQQILIGGFAVDSGQAITGDPCYLDKWIPWNEETDKFETHTEHKGEYGYLGACNMTLENEYGELGLGKAVVFNTGHGDGYYPVYATLDENGRVAEITVKFITDEDDE